MSLFEIYLMTGLCIALVLLVLWRVNLIWSASEEAERSIIGMMIESDIQYHADLWELVKPDGKLLQRQISGMKLWIGDGMAGLDIFWSNGGSLLERMTDADRARIWPHVEAILKDAGVREESEVRNG